MPRDVHLRRDDRAMQSFVEHQIGVLRDVLPIGEVARLQLERRGLFFVVQVATDFAPPGFAVVPEKFLELLEQIVFGTEVAEVVVAAGRSLGHRQLHLGPVVAVKGVPLDQHRVDVLTTEYPVECTSHRGGAGPGGAGDRDDRMLC